MSNSFGYTCEKCGDLVSMSRKKYLEIPITSGQYRRVWCDSCRGEILTKNNRSFRLGKPPVNRMVRCEHCKGVNPRKHYRLNPVDWRPEYVLCCLPCGVRNGFAPVDYTRTEFSTTRVPV